MVRSMFTGVAGLKAHQQMMDVIGNNIANVNTYGYKAGSVTFQDAIYQSLKASTGGNTSANGYGGQNPSQVGYGVEVGGISYDFGQGGAATTGFDLDCMISGTGFFIVGPMRTKDIDVSTDNDYAAMSNNGLSFSRVGRFSVDNNGFLVDDNRNYIYGYPLDSNSNPTDTEPKMDAGIIKPIQIPMDTSATSQVPYTINSYTIKADGTVVGVTDDSKTVTLGQIALASVGNPNGLTKSSSFYYQPSGNSGSISVVPAGGSTGSIESGCLEMAKVDLANEFANLILTQRGFQANSKIITVTDSMLEELVNMKR